MATIKEPSSKTRILIDWTQNTVLKKDVIKHAPLWGKVICSIVAYSEIAIPLSNGKGHTLATIEIEYEWTPPRCNECKVFDHGDDACPKNPKKGVPNKEIHEERRMDLLGPSISTIIHLRAPAKADENPNKSCTPINEDSDCEAFDEELVLEDRNGRRNTTEGASTPEFTAGIIIDEDCPGVAFNECQVIISDSYEREIKEDAFRPLLDQDPLTLISVNTEALAVG
ncbi:hypothetical protein Tco_1360344 [Tanacetum coccineum]